MLIALFDGPPGVALVRAAAAYQDLRDGRLVRLFDTVITAPGAYYLATPAEAVPSPARDAFATWLIDEAATYRVAALGAGITS